MTTILASGILRALVVIGSFALGWYLRGRYCACGSTPASAVEEG